MFNNNLLIDLHRHLDGNLRIDTIIDVAKSYKINLPALTKEKLIPHVRVTTTEPDLMSFIAKFKILQQVMVNYEIIKRIARENVEDAHTEGIDYIELRFSPFFMALEYHLDVDKVADAVCEGVEDAVAKMPIKANLIVIMSRTYGVDNCFKELNTALRLAKEKRIIGLDLAGDEASYPGSLFVRHFKTAYDAGLKLTAHAGEASGTESVKQAILELGVNRIGHGVKSIDDESVIELILDRKIGLEICPTSNVQTSTVVSYKSHPLKKFLQLGILATLNTDDPGISGIDLLHEYEVVKTKMGLSEKEISTLQSNALKVAFLTEKEKQTLKLKVKK